MRWDVSQDKDWIEFPWISCHSVPGILLLSHTRAELQDLENFLQKILQS